MSKTRVFVSFDYDHDETLKTFLVGQAKHDDSPFFLSDWSIKEPISGDWKSRAESRIRAIDVMAVICGQHTHTATGVSAEIEIAQKVATPNFLLKGHSNLDCTKPTAALSSDKVYNWTWDNLKRLIGGAR